MEIISNFYPKYPLKEDYSIEILNPYDINFYEAIFSKKEFYNLPKVEEKSSGRGVLMKHQINTARYLSSYTPYDELLLFFEPGTGKTCAAIGVCEKIREEKSKINGAIILNKGDPLNDNFLLELIFTCTTGKYIPEDYDNLTEKQKWKKMRKNVSTFYTFDTLEKFSKKISKLTDKQIETQYSNKIIVIDEAHNLRIEPNKDETRPTYISIHRFLHIIRNRKILLMSGTPMKDRPDEISSLLNLILPLNKQLPIGNEFIKEFMVEENDSTFSIKRKKLLKENYFKGIISYLRYPVSNIEKIFVGDFLPGLKYIKTYVTQMSSFQSEYYSKAYQKESGGKFYINSRNASQFVFPNGTWGNQGFNHYVKKKENKVIKISRVTGERQELIVNDYFMTKELYNEFKVADGLEHLKKFSCKFYKVLVDLKEKRNSLFFVYTSFVEGSGAILLSKILECFGYSRAHGKENTPGLRYGIITNRTATPKEIKRLLALYNSNKNAHGEYIQVMIGSKVIGEGFTLKNVTNIHILSPYWNYSELEQVIARGFRYNSHKYLEELGEQVKVYIYQHLSLVTPSDIKSVDQIMYKIAEKKDISIKRMERLLKEASFDCALNYERNFLPQFEDGSRECDYQNCKYNCEGITNLSGKKTDLSTYQLYYDEDDKKKIQSIIEDHFTTNFESSLEDILNLFQDSYTLFEILSVLLFMITSNIPIYDKYGFQCFLREDRNVYYLVNSIKDNTDYFSSYYTKKPPINEIIPFSKLIDTLYFENFNSILKSLVEGNNEMKIYIMSTMPYEIKNKFLEYSVIKIRDKEQNAFTSWIFNYFKPYIKYIDNLDTYVSIVNADKLKCLEPAQITWKPCKEEYINIVKSQLENKLGELETNTYGYYAIYNKETDQFWIRDVKDTQKINNVDGRKVTRGKIYQSWTIKSLIPLIVKFKLNYSEEKCKKASPAHVKKILETYIDPNTLDEENKCRVYYWVSGKKKDLKKALLVWFKEKNLLLEE